MNPPSILPVRLPDPRGPAPQVPAQIVLASIAGLWLCYFVLASLRGAIVGLEFQSEVFLRRLLVALASMAVTAALWPLLRALDRQAMAVRIAAILLAALPASLVLAAINQQAFADIESKLVAKLGEKEGIRIRRDEAGNVLVDVSNMPPIPVPPAAPMPLPDGSLAVPQVPPVTAAGAVTIDSETSTETRWRQLTDVALGRYFLLLAWAALYVALVAAEEARAAERREGEYRRAAQAAEAARKKIAEETAQKKAATAKRLEAAKAVTSKKSQVAQQLPCA